MSEPGSVDESPCIYLERDGRIWVFDECCDRWIPLEDGAGA